MHLFAAQGQHAVARVVGLDKDSTRIRQFSFKHGAFILQGVKIAHRGKRTYRKFHCFADIGKVVHHRGYIGIRQQIDRLGQVCRAQFIIEVDAEVFSEGHLIFISVRMQRVVKLKRA